MDNNKQETLSRLKFVGRVKKNEKINVKGLFVQPNTFSTSVSRTFYYFDNKYNTLEFLRITIKDSFEIHKFYEKSETPFERQLSANILHDLSAALQGLINLKITYANDIKFGCDIDTLIEEIEAKLNSAGYHKKKINENEEKSDKKNRNKKKYEIIS